jgi:hypothetical protein
MQRHIAFLMTLWSVTSCQSVGGRGADESPIWSLAPVESQVESWVDYMAELEGMNPRELKSEADRARKVAAEGRGWEEELRWTLAQIVQSNKAKNYQKAAELAQQVPQRPQFSPEFKAWLKLYQQQLFTVAALDKELTEEKRVRTDLEKKLKGLSDIEMDISQREKKSQLP